MKGFLKFGFFLLALAAACACIAAGPLAEAATSGTTDCAATIMPDSTIHIPAIGINGHLYSADMVYLPSNDGIYWFGVGNLQVADGIECSNAALFSGASGSYLLVMPSIAVGSDRYRAVLEYVPTRTATAEKTAQTIFRVDAEMKLRQIEQEESERTFDPSMLPVQFELNHTQHVQVGDAFMVDVSLKGTVQLGAFRPNNEPGEMVFSYITGPANGTLDITSATCSYPTSPDCTCVVKTVGSGGSPLTSGWVTVNSLEVDPVLSPWGVTLNYSIGLPPSSATLYARCCSESSCQEFEYPWGDVYIKYFDLVTAASLKGDHHEATDFSHMFIFKKEYWMPQTFINEFLSYQGNTELTLWPSANLLQ